MTGVVVPTYNRRPNVELMLMGLIRQDTTDFHVVIADDGSTDGTRELVEGLAATPEWGGRLRYVYCGPNQGMRASRTRNIGVAALDRGTELVIFIDSDIVMPADGISNYLEVHRAHPKSILMGPCDYLAPMDRDEMITAIERGELAAVRETLPTEPGQRVEGTWVTRDLRMPLFEHAGNQELPMMQEILLSLNCAWPVELYWRTGGFDEGMIGYGYEDLEFGARAAEAGATCVLSPQLWVVHFWHAKHSTAMAENQANLDYYLRRHHSDFIESQETDWSNWIHYHAGRGATLARTEEGVWAFNRLKRRRLLLPDDSWATRLGFCGHEIPDAEEAVLAKAEVAGTAHLT